MDKYIIVNEENNSILCKDKHNSRRYRQDRNNIDKHCVIIRTTKGRAEQERDYLNKNCNTGWEIQKVEPIVFYDNAEDREKYLTIYETLNEEEINRIRKETAKEFASKVKECKEIKELVELGYIVSYVDLCKEIDEIAKQFGVEVEE